MVVIFMGFSSAMGARGGAAASSERNGAGAETRSAPRVSLSSRGSRGLQRPALGDLSFPIAGSAFQHGREVSLTLGRPRVSSSSTKGDLRKRLAASRSAASRSAGAEGATAPEPLRQKDRRLMALWKAAGLDVGSPKG